MQILITGGAGFIGSSLSDRLLKQGSNIVVVDNFNDFYDITLKERNIKSNLANPKYKLYRGDICDAENLNKIFNDNKIDVVVHLAACAGVRTSIEKPLDYVKSNIYGTVNLLECMRNYDVKKMVFASSSSVYGNCRAEKFSEDLKISEPISPYAATKSACEQILYTYYNLYKIKSISLRFFTVYGPRQRPDLVIRKFTELILKGKEIPVYGDGTALRDYTYIDDIISGICSSINYKKTDYEIINLGGGNPVTVQEMISTLEKTIGKKAKIKYLPPQKGDVIKTISDISKAGNLLGYLPKTSFEEGINKYIKWYRKENNI